MAGQKFLKWAELTDFKPGLWTQDVWNMPVTAARQMDNCLPDLSGGLRASMKSATVSVTGLPTGSGISVCGYFIRGGQGSSGTESDRFLVLKNGTNFQVWRMMAGAASWSQCGANQAIGAGTGPNGVVFDTFTDSTGTVFVVFNIFQTAANDGVWTINLSTFAINNRLAGGATSVCVQDDRIIGAIGPTLRWSDSQSVSSFPAANNLPVQISRQNPNIVAMRATAPNDLLLGMQLAPWVLVRGDITNPVVTGMSDQHVPGGIQALPMSDLGLLFVAHKKGLYATGNGSSFKCLSEQLAVAEFTSANDVVVNEDFIVTSKGPVLDNRTQSWHKLTDLDPGGAWALASSVLSDTVSAANYISNSPVIWDYLTDESSRASSYTWKGAPLRSDDGRQIRIREVQLYARSFSAAATIDVSVGGTTRTKTLAASSGQHLSYLFDEYDETLDVTITADSETSAEAPTIEVIRIGSAPGHQLR